MERCAPDINFDGTCYSKKVLDHIAKSYNNMHDDKIKLSVNKKELWKQLDSKIKNCRYEDCWLKYLYIHQPKNKEIEDAIFKPEDPEDELITDLINRIMKQYERKYKNFGFMGTLPSDAHKSEVAALYDMKIPKKEVIGAVLNTKPHTHEGEHWVAILFHDNVVEYFDSLGKEPSPQILKFIKQQFPGKKVRINKKVYQKGGNECGVYVLEFITGRLDGKSFNRKINIDRSKFMRKLI